MARFDEDSQCEVMTPEERGRLRSECEAFDARRGKALHWAAGLVGAELGKMGCETTLATVRVAWRSVWRSLSGQPERQLAFTMTTPAGVLEVIDGTRA